MNRLTVTIGVVFTLIVAITLLNMQIDSNDAVVAPRPNNLLPTYSLMGINSTLFDQEGNLAYKVQAEKMSFYDNQNKTVFEHPSYTLFTDISASPWIVSAEKGELFAKRTLALKEGVTVRSTDQAGYVRMIKTQQLTIDLLSKEVTSEVPVIISGKSFLITSNGLKANLNSQQFELINHVKTHYETTKKE